MLRVDMSLFGGETMPLCRLGVILRSALAIGVRQTKKILRAGMPLFGGEAKPFHRLRVILRNALALLIYFGEQVLRISVALFGGAFNRAQSGLAGIAQKTRHP